ncbi:MAG: hypothetical protein H7Z42_15055 [Roseiflexaceae bacterium]|nr:hypothetical protein [Roseiflexaceae bacterium]
MRSANPSAFSPIVLLLAEVGGALLGGIILALLSALGISLLLADANLGMGLLTAQIYAGILGWGLGAGGGAALAGRLLGQRGNWLLAMIGPVVGGALVALLMRVFALGTLLTTLGIALALMVVIAVAGYNLRRRSYV